MGAVSVVKKTIVAHLIPRIPFGGGAETLLVDICRSIDRERFSVVVFYWAEGDDLAGALRQAGAVVVKLSFKNVLSLSSVQKLVRALKAYRVDILHTHFMDSDLLGFLSTWFTGLPMVMHVHSFPFPQTRRHALRYRIMSMKIGKIICVSQYVELFVAAATGIARKKFVVVPNGTDVERFTDHFSSREKTDLRAAFGFSSQTSVIGTVTRLESDKAVETLVKAVPLVLKRYPESRFLIVGYGREQARLEKLSRDLDIAGAVVFAGRREDVPMLLSIMDVFVVTAAEEAFGLSLLEALAAGKPVAAANACALPELVCDEENGLLFTARDEKSLAEKVLALLDDPAQAQRLAIQGQARSREFTSRVLAHSLENVYDEVLGCG